MRISIILLLLAFFINACSLSNQNPSHTPNESIYLFDILKVYNLTFGTTKANFLLRCPDSELKETKFQHREVYIDSTISNTQFDWVSVYVDTDGENPIYQFVLKVNKYQSAFALAEEKYGRPNHKNNEWRFTPEMTELPYTIAIWIHKERIYIATELPGAEWEGGFDGNKIVVESDF